MSSSVMSDFFNISSIPCLRTSTAKRNTAFPFIFTYASCAPIPLHTSTSVSPLVLLNSDCPTFNACRKPVHALLKSNASTFSANPSSFCTIAAVDGNALSAVEVATITAPISAISTPDASTASYAALTASDVVFSCVHLYLFLMPVLVVIHSSFVSTIRLKSSFVIISSGSAFPVDTI